MNGLKIKNQDLELKRSATFRNYVLLILVFLSILLFVFLIYSYKTKLSNSKLQNLLEENHFLLGESNHRIKNNLQLISALIHQEITKSKPGTKESLVEISEKIEAVSSLHKLLYLTENKEVIQIKDYLNEIQLNFDQFFKQNNISLDFQVEAIELDIQNSLNLGLLLTELFINSLKHAFNSKLTQAKITFSLQLMDGSMNFNYSDNGIGMDNLKDLKLVNMICKQLKVKADLKNVNGFQFQFSKELKKYGFKNRPEPDFI